MSFFTMTQELLGVPGMNFALAQTKINEALGDIYDEQLWSFQLRDGGWLTPGLLGGTNYTGSENAQNLLSPGSITVTPYSTSIIGDAIATAAWLANTLPLLTVQQIRSPYYGLYNIIALGQAGTVAYLTVNTAGSGQTPGTYTVNATDPGGSGTGASAQITVASNGQVVAAPVVINPGSGYTNPTFTLVAGGTPATFTATQNALITVDRPWMEPLSGPGIQYMIYQAYFPAPFADFKRFLAIQDTTNDWPMNFWGKTKRDLADEDAQRTVFDDPSYVVPYGPDVRPGSATYGYPMFELWPHPLSNLPYTLSVLRRGPQLVNASDTVPSPITEAMLKWKAYAKVYIWKESQKGDDMQRGSGANWMGLAAAAEAQYEQIKKPISINDRSLVELYSIKLKPGQMNNEEPFATINGQLNLGGWGS